MRDNMIRQQKAYIAQYGAAMSTAQLQHMHKTMFALQSLYYEEPQDESDALPFLHDIEFWRESFPSHCFGEDELRSSLEQIDVERKREKESESESVNGEENLNNKSKRLETDGFVIGEKPGKRVVDLCEKVSEALEQLRKRKFPPNFIFVFNEAWLLLDEQWCGPAEDVLGKDSIMEADLNVWSLRRETSEKDERYVGGNFSASHRDQTYSSCHNEDEEVTSVNLWFPCNKSGAKKENGAMRVLPIPHDDFFYCPSHPSHMNTKVSLDSAPENSVEILECSTGTASMWSPSLIHWGGSCEIDCIVEPRASMAVTFRKNGAPPSKFGENPAPASGPPTLLRQDFHNLTLARRLAYVAKGVLSYSHWHPGFPGISLHAENE